MKTILVVDDEKNIRELYRVELEDDGHKVILASDGDEAVDIINSGEYKINLVVLDIKMERKDGIETLKEIIQENREMKVILNTAYSSYKLDFTSWLADAYLIKSSNIDELKDKIKELLQSDDEVEG